MRSLQHLPSEARCGLPCSFSAAAGCSLACSSPALAQWWLASEETCATALCLAHQTWSQTSSWGVGLGRTATWWQNSRALFSGIKSFHPFYFKSRQNVKWPEISLAENVLQRKCSNHSWWEGRNQSQSVLLRLLFSFGTCDTCDSSPSHQTELPSTSFREVPSQAKQSSLYLFHHGPRKSCTS